MRIFKIETQFLIYAYPVYNAQPVSNNNNNNNGYF